MAQAAGDLAQATYKRDQDLFRDQGISAQDFDTTADNYGGIGRLTAYQANVDRLQALEAFKIIHAPFDGIVTARNTDIGAYFPGSGTPLFRMAATSRLSESTVSAAVGPTLTAGILATTPDMAVSVCDQHSVRHRGGGDWNAGFAPYPAQPPCLRLAKRADERDHVRPWYCRHRQCRTWRGATLLSVGSGDRGHRLYVAGASPAHRCFVLHNSVSLRNYQRERNIQLLKQQTGCDESATFRPSIASRPQWSVLLANSGSLPSFPGFAYPRTIQLPSG